MSTQMPANTPAAVPTAAGAPAPAFTRSERRALRSLRDRYRQDRDMFTERERAHLHFLRWLYRTGRL